MMIRKREAEQSHAAEEEKEEELTSRKQIKQQ